MTNEIHYRVLICCCQKLAWPKWFSECFCVKSTVTDDGRAEPIPHTAWAGQWRALSLCTVWAAIELLTELMMNLAHSKWLLKCKPSFRQKRVIFMSRDVAVFSKEIVVIPVDPADSTKWGGDRSCADHSSFWSFKMAVGPAFLTYLAKTVELTTQSSLSGHKLNLKLNLSGD